MTSVHYKRYIFSNKGTTDRTCWDRFLFRYTAFVMQEIMFVCMQVLWHRASTIYCQWFTLTCWWSSILYSCQINFHCKPLLSLSEQNRVIGLFNGNLLTGAINHISLRPGKTISRHPRSEYWKHLFWSFQPRYVLKRLHLNLVSMGICNKLSSKKLWPFFHCYNI